MDFFFNCSLSLPSGTPTLLIQLLTNPTSGTTDSTIKINLQNSFHSLNLPGHHLSHCIITILLDSLLSILHYIFQKMSLECYLENRLGKKHIASLLEDFQHSLPSTSLHPKSPGGHVTSPFSTIRFPHIQLKCHFLREVFPHHPI